MGYHGEEFTPGAWCTTYKATCVELLSTSARIAMGGTETTIKGPRGGVEWAVCLEATKKDMRRILISVVYPKPLQENILFEYCLLLHAHLIPFGHVRSNSMTLPFRISS